MYIHVVSLGAYVFLLITLVVLCYYTLKNRVYSQFLAHFCEKVEISATDSWFCFIAYKVRNAYHGCRVSSVSGIAKDVLDFGMPLNLDFAPSLLAVYTVFCKVHQI